MRRLTRAQRREQFLQLADAAFDRLEVWCDAHAQASFGEIEAEARQQRRALMGQALAILINGRDNGVRTEALHCAQCGAVMEFHEYRDKTVRGLEGDTPLQRAYYVCSQGCGETFFPLDQTLRLRRDPWSEGAAQVAAEQGLKGRSFDDAAASCRRAAGLMISADSVRRITEAWGARVAEARAAEVEQVFTLAQDVRPAEAPVIEPIQPVGERGNVSTDGHMILVRGEGWKEVKLSVLSAVDVRPAEERRACESRRAHDPWVRLSGHSCQAGLWDADTLGRYQYGEGLRRGLEHCRSLTSVNDAAAWIERVTAENFPQAIRIIDWSHAMTHLWQVAHAAFGEGTARSQEWARSQEEALWQGRAAQVAHAIGALSSTAPEVAAGQGYFLAHQEQMRYDQYRAAGYPIGSGTVESGGKNYVQRRMKRPGRGWNRPIAQGMLALLSEMHSNRFDHAWERFARPTIRR